MIAQTLYTRTDSIAITGDSVTLRSGPFKGTIQWQQSLNGQLWNDLEGKTAPMLRVASTSEGYYRAQITDETCLPVYSDTAVVVAFKTGNTRVIDPDEVPMATFLERDDRRFTFVSTSGASIPVNTVFLENDKESDIRVVSGVTQNGDTLIVNTLPGKMEDLFVNQEFKLTTELVALTAGGSYLTNTALSNALTDENGFIHPVEVIDLNSTSGNIITLDAIGDLPVVNVSQNLNGEKLYNKNGMELTITDGFFNMRAVLKSEFNFEQTKFDWNELPSGKLKSCKFYTDGEKTTTETKLLVETMTNGPVSVDETFILKQDVYKHLFKFWVGEIPVWMYVKVDLMAKVKGDFSNTFSATGGTLSEINIDLGSNYLDGQWSPIFNYSKAFSLFDPIFDGHISYSTRCEVYPLIETSFYYSVCPSLEIVPYISDEMDVSINGNYISELSAGFDARTGVDGNILGYGISAFSHEFNILPETIYNEPTTLDIVSGNNQEGMPGEELLLPIVLMVLNSEGNPVANVPVHFWPSLGAVDSNTIITNNEGTVSVKWTLGEILGDQTLEAFLKDGDDIKRISTIVIISSESKVELPTVETTAIISISENSALCGGNVVADGGGSVTSRGVCWNTSGSPTTANSKTVNGMGVGIFTSSLFGLTPNTTYYVRAYATNAVGTTYGNQLSFKTGVGGCPTGAFTDSRDGKTYKTIVIGTQTWMAENLAYLPSVTSMSVWSETTPCYYVNDLAQYGVLYNWPAALNACPVGWHLPSDAEWDVMAVYLGGREVAGGKMKTVLGWRSPNAAATNESCFSALPAGGFNHGYFFNTSERGYWWTSTAIDQEIVWARSAYYNIPELYRFFYYRPAGYSVRCLKN
jgi:uncharacterized protein (TIGR02145 family)